MAIAMMPASLGVLRWPGEGGNLVTLADEAELPFADYSIDRVLLVHALEVSDEAMPLLREVWRVLAAGRWSCAKVKSSAWWIFLLQD